MPRTPERWPKADPPAGGYETADVKEDFLKRLGELVDLKAIAKSGIKVVFDPFWGAGRGYSCHILRQAGVTVETVHDYRDVLFGGHAPEPDDHLLGDARAKMKEVGAKIGIATDGDADRFGIVDEDGTFIQPNYIIALLFDYLVETRGWKNGVAKSVATTNLVNALAEHHKVQLYETPVGFKYIGELILAGQNRHWRRGVGRIDDSRARAGEGRRDCRTAGDRDGCGARKKSGHTVTGVI